MYAYQIPPIDFGLFNLKSVYQVMNDIAFDGRAHDEITLDPDAVMAFVDQLAKARRLAAKVGWEGDGQVRVFFLPGKGEELTYGFVFKQENNGSTFVVSPFMLYWLMDRCTQHYREE